MSWKPGESFSITFSDKTGKIRTDNELTSMVNEMIEISNRYGFDLLCSGSWESMKKVALGEEKLNLLMRVRKVLEI